ncbi:hypothetical protein [Nocardioides sp. OK12]|uniref:hypothetical protein n=1 Tax=Nocardioides sp. OK12 TaxID=2758661 RepID=UPI0021C31E1B|nr:hypothetical protein [Nocardioides sp. OK12]
MQHTEVFGADAGAVGDYAADNGFIVAVDAILVDGTDGNGEGGTTHRDKNVAGYFGTHRSGGTRSGWALNSVTTTEVSPSSTMQTIGYEIDINNNSGVDAGELTSLDGLVVITPSPGLASSSMPPTARSGSSDTRYIFDAEVGAHQSRTCVAGVDRQVGELDARGVLTLSNNIGGAPTITAGGSAAAVPLTPSTKGGTIIALNAPTRLPAYTTAGRPAAFVGVGLTVCPSRRPMHSNGATWRDAAGVAV